MTNNYKPYKSKKQTGLPFDIEVDPYFHNCRAVYQKGMSQELTTKDIIQIHILIELRKKQKTK